MFYFVISAANDDDFNLQSDCFVCAILTHGEEGLVYGIDDKIEVKVLLEPFKGNNCRGLVGKPKIFFIQVSTALFILSLHVTLYFQFKANVYTGKCTHFQRKQLPALVAHLDQCLTGDQEVVGFDPHGVGNILSWRFDHEIFMTVIPVC